MPSRFAIYFAPAVDAPLWRAAMAWLDRPELSDLAISARRYGFHATIKAPMHLTRDFAVLEDALQSFAATHGPVELSGLAPRVIGGGFVALTTEPQPAAVTAFAAEVVSVFEPFRVPLSTEERERRLRAPLSERHIELVDRFGYPYVLEQFQFHMTLTDRLAPNQQDEWRDAAADWFAPVLAEPVMLDRLVVFEEPEPGAAFRRLDSDYVLAGG